MSAILGCDSSATASRRSFCAVLEFRRRRQVKTNRSVKDAAHLVMQLGEIMSPAPSGLRHGLQRPQTLLAVLLGLRGQIVLHLRTTADAAAR